MQKFNVPLWFLTAVFLCGAFLMILSSPRIDPPENCGVRRIQQEVVTAYVLKAPEPQKCEPVEIKTPAVCPEPEAQPQTQTEPEAEPEAEPRRHRWRRHRRWRR